MGWDAFATKNGEDIKHLLNPYKVKDNELRKKFKEAVKLVRSKYEYADGLLDCGGLDCSDCAYALQDATGMICWGKPLNPKQVKEYYKKADWENVDDSLEKELVASAKEFLKVCAENNMGIRFSW